MGHHPSKPGVHIVYNESMVYCVFGVWIGVFLAACHFCHQVVSSHFLEVNVLLTNFTPN